MKSLLLTLAAAVSLHLHAVEIVDQGNVFPELARYTAGAKFEDVLKCGQVQTFAATTGACQFNCNANFCMSSCQQPNPKRFSVSVEDCTADSAHVYSENGMSLAVTREDFTKGGGTFAWSFLQDIGRHIKPAGKIVLTRIWPMQVGLITNGDKTTAWGYEIWGEVDLGAGLQRPGFQLLVLPQFKDVRQIARFSLNPGEEFYKANGIVNDEGF